MSRQLFCSHHHDDLKIQTEGNNTDAVVVADFGNYSALNTVYNLYIKKVIIVEFKMYNHKTMCALGRCSCILTALVVKS